MSDDSTREFSARALASLRGRTGKCESRKGRGPVGRALWGAAVRIGCVIESARGAQAPSQPAATPVAS